MVETVTAHKCKDGTYFDNLKDALKYEARIGLMESFEKRFSHFDQRVASPDLIKWLDDNRGKLRDFLGLSGV